MTRQEMIDQLKQYRPVHQECERLRKRIADKRTDMYGIRSAVTGASCVKSNAVSDSVERVVEAMDSMVHYYTEKVAQAEAVERKTVQLIDCISDSEKRCVLFMHYIEGKTFFEISEEMCYSERSIWNRHNAAIEELCGMTHPSGASGS